ncbi:MAG: lipopolysaccharide heptosyltransferase II, partial [Verrucomicrobia bacterium]|nr:lipopolysaccharide heptosyltransferase II [Verrucomicrobiota bacterium]
MQWLVYASAKLLLSLARLVPLAALAALGRCAGRLAFAVDRRHRRVALQNLRIAFPEKSAAERRAIVRESFARVGQNFVLMAKVAQLPRERIADLLEVTGIENFRSVRARGKGVVALLGHFGNWELLSRVNNVARELKVLDVLRPLASAGLDKLVRELRSAGDMHFVERGDATAAAVAWLRENETVSLFVDQRAGAGHGLWLPVFGRLTSCEIGPAILARRTGAGLMPTWCEPCGPLRWRLHLLPEIPTAQRSTEEIIADIVRLQETLIRRDPANWMWGHDRWKMPLQTLAVKLPKALPTPANLQPFRILIRATNWLGDAVMTMPTVQRIKQSRPDARVTVLTEPKLADLWRLHPDVDEVIVHERADNPFTLLRRALKLRRADYDAAIIFPNSWRSAFPIWLAGIPRRVGYRGHARAWMLTDPLPELIEYQTRPVMNEENIQRFARGEQPASVRPDYKHQVHHHLRLVLYLGGNATPCAARLKPVAPTAGMRLPQDKPLLALNAGAEYGPAKRWPLERFIAAAKQVVERENVRWVIIGGLKEAELGATIVRELGDANAINIAGKTTLAGLCETLAQCRLLLTNDSGPMHLAAALGKPVVAIFGSTEPAL